MQSADSHKEMNEYIEKCLSIHSFPFLGAKHLNI